MEFKVNEYQLPDKLTFNYEELKQELIFLLKKMVIKVVVMLVIYYLTMP